VKHQRERDHIPDGAEIRIFWLRSFTRDGVVVEGDFFHTKLRLAGFDLNICSFAAADKSFKQFIKFLDVSAPAQMSSQ
jgi:hypothetical protein